jgi:hypothetical protein
MGLSECALFAVATQRIFVVGLRWDLIDRVGLVRAPGGRGASGKRLSMVFGSVVGFGDWNTRFVLWSRAVRAYI